MTQEIETAGNGLFYKPTLEITLQWNTLPLKENFQLHPF
jgi:hypothetical protein